MAVPAYAKLHFSCLATEKHVMHVALSMLGQPHGAKQLRGNQTSDSAKAFGFTFEGYSDAFTQLLKGFAQSQGYRIFLDGEGGVWKAPRLVWRFHLNMHLISRGTTVGLLSQ